MGVVVDMKGRPYPEPVESPLELTDPVRQVPFYLFADDTIRFPPQTRHGYPFESFEDEL